jgi:hypothetical protein
LVSVNETGATKSFVDDAGDKVLRFISAARNLSKVGELTAEVTEIAESGAWRRYRTALGVDEWRESELDYFLMAAELSYEDVSRVLAYTRDRHEIAAMMDPRAASSQRRNLEDAAKNWHAPVPETLVERAQRLGWTRGEKSSALRVPPLPHSTRVRQMHGMTQTERARRSRATRIAEGRRREIDAMIQELRQRLRDDLERRYVVDQLASVTSRYRQTSSGRR